MHNRNCVLLILRFFFLKNDLYLEEIQIYVAIKCEKCYDILNCSNFVEF